MRLFEVCKNLFRSAPGVAKIREFKKFRTIRVLGFTLLELLIVVAIMSTLAAIAVYHYSIFIQQTKGIRAKSDIEAIAQQIDEFREDNGRYPDSLEELGGGPFIDPWGNPYQYVNIATAHRSLWRRDRNKKPINTYYDLWSNGPDGKFTTQIKGDPSRDDIIRAWDGLFIGGGQELDELYGHPRKWRHPDDDTPPVKGPPGQGKKND
jgi:general secretion pathway protein G